jgi:hypothetical protein
MCLTLRIRRSKVVARKQPASCPRTTCEREGANGLLPLILTLVCLRFRPIPPICNLAKSSDLHGGAFLASARERKQLGRQFVCFALLQRSPRRLRDMGRLRPAAGIRAWAALLPAIRLRRYRECASPYRFRLHRRNDRRRYCTQAGARRHRRVCACRLLRLDLGSVARIRTRIPYSSSVSQAKAIRGVLLRCQFARPELL